MENQSIYDEDIIVKDDFLDLSNVVAGSVKNLGSNTLKLGLLDVPGGKDIPIETGNTMLQKGTKIKITFSGGTGQLHYRLIRFSKCSCKSKQ